MKKFFISLNLVLVSFGSSEQPVPSIVYDPTNAAQLAEVFSTITELKESADEWKADANFISKVAEQGMEVKRLVAMLEGMICATDELELYASIDRTLQICENKLEFDITLMKIEGVSEKLNWITTGTVLLSQYETIQSLKDLNDQLEEAIRKVNSLNAKMRGNLLRNLNQLYEKETYADNFSMLTEMNI